MKRILALLLAALALAALLAACKKTPAPGPGAVTTGPAGEAIVPPGGSVPGGEAAPGEAEPEERTEAPGQKNYSSPKRIPTVKRGKDYEGANIPDGVADIFSMDGRLLFTFVTRLEGDDATKTTRDFYTLFEYNTETGGCRAVSPEVGYITRAGGRFLYDKAGMRPGSPDYWDVPYFTNNGAWTDEKQITGEEARQLLAAPPTALIKGKEQPYTVQHSGTAVVVDLPESGEALTLTLDVKPISGSASADGLTIDIRGAAREKLWLTIGHAAKDGSYVKELYCTPLTGGALKPIRHNGEPILVDPLSDMRDGALYGYSILPNGSRVLLRVDTATEKAQPLATVRESVWHFVANAAYVLYEIPKKADKVELGCKRIAAEG